MKTPVIKRYKISNEKLTQLNPLSRKLLEYLAWDSGDGMRIHLMELEDAHEVRIVMNPQECIEMLELKEVRDDEI